MLLASASSGGCLVACVMRAHDVVQGMGGADSPESRLAGALTLAVGASGAWAHVALGREAVARGVHGLAEILLRGTAVGLLAGGLALELVVVLEAHCREAIRAG